jgi:hypothetical protein
MNIIEKIAAHIKSSEELFDFTETKNEDLDQYEIAEIKLIRTVPYGDSCKWVTEIIMVRDPVTGKPVPKKVTYLQCD